MTEKKFTHKALLWLKAKKIFNNPRACSWIHENYRSILDFQNTNLRALENMGWPEKLNNKFTYFKKQNENLYVEELSKLSINMVSIEDDLYPPLLKEINDPPTLLFFKGDISLINNKCVGIVGSRRCSNQGRQFAGKIAKILAENGYVIVSGLAYGIDTCAHFGALEGGTTVSVLGCGLNIVYPSSNKTLFKEIEEKGCLISEYVPNSKPLRFNFPYRNRIISGLSEKLIVIEAAEKSGALITANLALDQGKEVIATAGNPWDMYSKGCNLLIKDGAYLLDCIDDLETHFDLKKGLKDSKINNDLKDNPVVKMLLKQSMSLEELAINTGLDASRLFQIVTELEISKLIHKENDNKYFIKL